MKPIKSDKKSYSVDYTFTIKEFNILKKSSVANYDDDRTIDDVYWLYQDYEIYLIRTNDRYFIALGIPRDKNGVYRASGKPITIAESKNLKTVIKKLENYLYNSSYEQKAKNILK